MIELTVYRVLIFLADIWLHLATTTVSFVQLLPVSPTISSFGRGLSPNCSSIYANAVPGGAFGILPCTLDRGASNTFLIGATEGYKTVNNISTLNQLITVNQSNQIYVLLGDVNAPNNLDFSASTFGISTQCTPISTACNLESTSGATTPYNCTAAFNGDLTLATLNGAEVCLPLNNWNMTFFNDSRLTEPANYANAPNPVYIGITAIVNVNGDDGQLYNDPEIVHPEHGGDAFVLSCTSTVYDITYNWVNGSAKSISILNPANTTLAGIMFAGLERTSNGQAQLTNGATLAGFSNTSEELAIKIALVYSQTALGFAAGVLSPRGNLEEQSREEFLVARVPFAPFYTLVILNLVYVVVGVFLACLALCANAKRGVRATQVRLSIWGIVAYGFEKQSVKRSFNGQKDLFEENGDGERDLSVIGVTRNSSQCVNDYTFRVWRQEQGPRRRVTDDVMVAERDENKLDPSAAQPQYKLLC